MTVGVAESWSSRESRESSGWSGSRSAYSSVEDEADRRLEQVIDRVLGEYEQHRTGRLNLLQTIDDRGKGVLYSCGDETSAPWAIAYVRRADRAVMPLAVGGYRHVCELAGMLSEQDLADESRWSPPRVLLDGAPRTFQPTYGRYLLGIARSGERVVMLVAIGEQVGVLLLDDPMSRPSVLFIGSTLGLRDLDVDQLAALRRPAKSSRRRGPRKRPVVSASTQVHHLRIAVGEEFETGDGPAVPEVVEICLDALADRTIDAARGSVGGGVRVRGVSFVRPVLRAIYRLGLHGSLDLCGRISELHRQLTQADPSLDLTAAQLGQAIKLLERTGCCLVMRMSERIWKIRVVGLSDPRSKLHLQLCKETGGRFIFGGAANSGPEVAESQPRARSAFDGSVGEGGADARRRGESPPDGEPTTPGDAYQVGHNFVALGEAYQELATLTAERDELLRERELGRAELDELRRERDRGRAERDELRRRVDALEGTLRAAPQERSASWDSQVSQPLEPKAERVEEHLADTELPRSEVPPADASGAASRPGERAMPEMSEMSEDPGPAAQRQGSHGDPDEAVGASEARTPEMSAEPGCQGQVLHGNTDDGVGEPERAVSEAYTEPYVRAHGRHRDADEGLGQSELEARYAAAIMGVVATVSEVRGLAGKAGALQSRLAGTRALVARLIEARRTGGRVARAPVAGGAEAAPGRERQLTLPWPVGQVRAQMPRGLRIRSSLRSSAVVAHVWGQPRGTAEEEGFPDPVGGMEH